jgi:hypothetical protein
MNTYGDVVTDEMAVASGNVAELALDGSQGQLSCSKIGGAGENRTHDRGFADLGLATWLPRRIVRYKRHAETGTLKRKALARCRGFKKKLERETGIEPATSTLARSHSTAELLPLVLSFYCTCAFPDKFPGTARTALAPRPHHSALPVRLQCHR